MGGKIKKEGGVGERVKRVKIKEKKRKKMGGGKKKRGGGEKKRGGWG